MEKGQSHTHFHIFVYLVHKLMNSSDLCACMNPSGLFLKRAGCAHTVVALHELWWFWHCWPQGRPCMVKKKHYTLVRCMNLQSSEFQRRGRAVTFLNSHRYRDSCQLAWFEFMCCQVRVCVVLHAWFRPYAPMRRCLVLIWSHPLSMHAISAA